MDIKPIAFMRKVRLGERAARATTRRVGGSGRSLVVLEDTMVVCHVSHGSSSSRSSTSAGIPFWWLMAVREGS